MPTDSAQLARIFFDATRELACHTGSLQERLADTYADHLLQVVAADIPAELQPVFRELEERMNAADEGEGDEDAADDPFRAAAQRLSDDEARALIERIVALFGRLAGPAPT
jgi:hypothetical protein